MSAHADRTAGLGRAGLVAAPLRDSLLKLDPRIQVRNPVMFVVYLGRSPPLAPAPPAGPGRVAGVHPRDRPLAVADGPLCQLRRGDRRAMARSRPPASGGHASAGDAHRLTDRPRATEQVPAPDLRPGDLVLVNSGEMIPSATARWSRASRRWTRRRAITARRPVVREERRRPCCCHRRTRDLTGLVIRITRCRGRASSTG
ncbi:MAG: hypothetical protein U0790_06850 [Isosphaeraceae bacterium]